MASNDFFHVVSDRPLTTDIITFDAERRSGLWRRVQERSRQVEALYADPASAPDPLDHHLAVAFRELALEEVRAGHYADLPSRLASLYVSRRLLDAERWSELFVNSGRATYSIVRLAVDGPTFTADARNSFTGSLDRTRNQQLAHHYWQNLPFPDGGEPIVEVLAGGPIRVVEVIRDINANVP